MVFYFKKENDPLLTQTCMFQRNFHVTGMRYIYVVNDDIKEGSLIQGGATTHDEIRTLKRRQDRTGQDCFVKWLTNCSFPP
jgi:hypothetical protein